MDNAILAAHTMKIEGNEKINKYVNHARDLNKQWNMNGTGKLIVVGAIWTVPESLEKSHGIWRSKTLQSNPADRGVLVSLRLQWKLTKIWDLGFALVYGTSTIVGHLMPNPFQTYIKYDYRNILQITFFNKPELIFLFFFFLHTVKCFHLISNNLV